MMHLLLRRLVLSAAALLATLSACQAGPKDASATLDAARARGAVACGVGSGVPGFAEVDERGNWSGFEVEICQALASAVFGRRDAVKLKPVTAAERFSTLASGGIDVLLRSTTWTLTRDTEMGLRFVTPMVFDGHKLLVRRSRSISSVLEMSGTSICVEAGSTAEQAVADYFSQRRMRYEVVSAPTLQDALKTYLAQGCKALAGGGSQLAALRNRIPSAGEHALLPETISREPLGPLVRDGDERWFGIVRWTVLALIAAEDLGITAANVEQQRSQGSTEARRLLGGEGELGRLLGLEPGWAFNVIRQVGNYGEIFDRNLGMRSPLKLERGLNNLWSRNGLLFAPHVR